MIDRTHLGKYEIQGVLGEGGMGKVYQALDPFIRRLVAIKAIEKARLDAPASRMSMVRFRNEAQAAGRLLHPGIVAVYDYGEDDEIAYIVMEYVRGKSLHEHLSTETRYNLAEAWDILKQLLDAIGYSHAQGVVHRDLKPANILINEDGRIKISDFGIARLDSNQLTDVGEVVGTPYYMAPEQVLGDPVDYRADLYAIGIICYQLLTGRRPFNGAPMEVMEQVIETMPRDPSQVNPDLPAGLDRLMRRALAKKPNDRFQNAGELTEELRQTLDGVPSRCDRTGLDAAPLTAPERKLPPLSGIMPTARRVNAADPFMSPPPQSGPPSVVCDPDLMRPRILFVDDDERVLNELRSLVCADYRVVIATNGEQALEALNADAFDVIVSEQRMLGMPRAELLRRVREIAPDTVRIALTGDTDLASVARVINEGEIYRFVRKPWDNGELAKTLQAAVAFSRALREASRGTIPPHVVDGALIVVEREPDLIRTVRECFGRRYKVRYAPSADDALDVMANEDVAVLLVDLDGHEAHMATLLKLLKHEQPQMVAIVATRASDSELLIELINQAQIYRFLTMPPHAQLVTQHIEAALARHRALRRNPELAQQQRGDVPPHTVRESSLGQQILRRLRLLRAAATGG